MIIIVVDPLFALVIYIISNYKIAGGYLYCDRNITVESFSWKYKAKADFSQILRWLKWRDLKWR